MVSGVHKVDSGWKRKQRFVTGVKSFIALLVYFRVLLLKRYIDFFYFSLSTHKAKNKIPAHMSLTPSIKHQHCSVTPGVVWTLKCESREKNFIVGEVLGQSEWDRKVQNIVKQRGEVSKTVRMRKNRILWIGEKILEQCEWIRMF